MMQSLLSSNKDVVRILPVAKLDAKDLHCVLKHLIKEQEGARRRVIAVISDNNFITRKALSFFSDTPKFYIGLWVYAHPHDPFRPLFFVLDSVHILKCIRNNCLNQRSRGTCMFSPDITKLSSDRQVFTASFGTLRKTHEEESNDLVRLALTLPVKALNSSNLERQHVKFTLKIFNLSNITTLTSSNEVRMHTEGEHVALFVVSGPFCAINCLVGAPEWYSSQDVELLKVNTIHEAKGHYVPEEILCVSGGIMAPTADVFTMSRASSFCACAVTAQLAPSMGALVLVGKHEPGRPSLVHLCAVTELSRLALAAYRNASALCGLRLHELFYSERKHAFLQVPVREATCRKERCLGSCCEETECRRFAVGAQQTFSDLQRAFHNRYGNFKCL
ncbi:hypothetical protein HPB51_015720 [Rhipicephalus microplus]|uniref:Uncharacterized protein n=1 Tax=Rhipicephalus microplus TaxID=6941 RepID=A0A9J6EGW6_RHIMP|nr:hypothetical protein HPB51_015720 [Rhipicephalus microplus]